MHLRPVFFFFFKFLFVGVFKGGWHDVDLTVPGFTVERMEGVSDKPLHRFV